MQQALAASAPTTPPVAASPARSGVEGGPLAPPDRSAAVSGRTASIDILLLSNHSTRQYASCSYYRFKEHYREESRMPSIGEAARRSGVPLETIRYYERAGVVPRPPRSESGRRVYDDAGIARLCLIKRCRDLGFSLSEARALLALSENSEAPCGDVKVIAEDHLAEVGRKIRALRDLEAALAELVRECAEGNIACPALRTLAGP